MKNIIVTWKSDFKKLLRCENCFENYSHTSSVTPGACYYDISHAVFLQNNLVIYTKQKYVNITRGTTNHEQFLVLLSKFHKSTIIITFMLILIGITQNTIPLNVFFFS